MPSGVVLRHSISLVASNIKDNHIASTVANLLEPFIEVVGNRHVNIDSLTVFEIVYNYLAHIFCKFPLILNNEHSHNLSH